MSEWFYRMEQPSYILLLIRDGHVRNWKELYQHYAGESDYLGRTGEIVLEQTLSRLVHAGFITVSRPSRKLEVTDLVSKVQLCLGISIAKLAKGDPRHSMMGAFQFGGEIFEKLEKLQNQAFHCGFLPIIRFLLSNSSIFIGWSA